MTDRTKTPLPAGEYLIGDPCYAFDNYGPDYWGVWLDATPTMPGTHSWPRLMDAEIQGFRVVGMGTAYGDGAYNDQFGNEYGVDAGMIGAVPTDALVKLYPEYAGLDEDSLEAKTQMKVFTFDEPFDVSYENGVITIGHIEIDTDPEFDEDEDLDDEWSDEDEDEDEDED